MKTKLSLAFFLLFFMILTAISAGMPNRSIRILVITGGHDYNKASFAKMLTSLGNEISFEIIELPAAYDMFQPENRDKYDVLVFYHMWQTITDEQEKMLADCIRKGKPLVVLHHSICAFDNWDEYIHIVGGKYFHHVTTIHGIEYPASSYEDDRYILIKVIDTVHPVTKGLKDFELFDETYKDYYLEPGIKPLLQTDDSTSVPVIGWTAQYGKSRVVTIQPGHDTPTFQDNNYQRLLLQAILYVYKGN